MQKTGGIVLGIGGDNAADLSTTPRPALTPLYPAVFKRAPRSAEYSTDGCHRRREFLESLSVLDHPGEQPAERGQESRLNMCRRDRDVPVGQGLGCCRSTYDNALESE